MLPFLLQTPDNESAQISEKICLVIRDETGKMAPPFPESWAKFSDDPSKNWCNYQNPACAGNPLINELWHPITFKFLLSIFRKVRTPVFVSRLVSKNVTRLIQIADFRWFEEGISTISHEQPATSKPFTHSLHWVVEVSQSLIHSLKKPWTSNREPRTINQSIYCAFNDLPDFAKASMIEVEYPGEPCFNPMCLCGNKSGIFIHHIDTLVFTPVELQGIYLWLIHLIRKRKHQ